MKRFIERWQREDNGWRAEVIYSVCCIVIGTYLMIFGLILMAGR